MNCKQGDLAAIQGPTDRFAGWLVDVLYSAPMVSHQFPDGTPSEPASSSTCWVVRSLGSSFGGDNGNGWHLRYVTRYAQIPDRFLRPIRPDGEADEISHVDSKPEEVTA